MSGMVDRSLKNSSRCLINLASRRKNYPSWRRQLDQQHHHWIGSLSGGIQIQFAQFAAGKVGRIMCLGGMLLSQHVMCMESGCRMVALFALKAGLHRMAA